MGQALKIREKRRNRKKYLERKKERELTARITSNKPRSTDDKTKKAAAPAKKKPAPKKAAAKTPAEKAPESVETPETPETATE